MNEKYDISMLTDVIGKLETTKEKIFNGKISGEWELIVNSKIESETNIRLEHNSDAFELTKELIDPRNKPKIKKVVVSIGYNNKLEPIKFYNQFKIVVYGGTTYTIGFQTENGLLQKLSRINKEILDMK